MCVSVPKTPLKGAMTQCRAETSVTMKTSGLMYCVPHGTQLCPFLCARIITLSRSMFGPSMREVSSRPSPQLPRPKTRSICSAAVANHGSRRRREPWVKKKRSTHVRPLFLLIQKGEEAETEGWRLVGWWLVGCWWCGGLWGGLGRVVLVVVVGGVLVVGWWFVGWVG